MCGISGEIRFDHQMADASKIHAMNQAMVSRGPDDQGVMVQGNRAFGHRRLMIMDLSNESQQPMYDNALGLGIVFNGAIYNYPEIRQELIGKGYIFYSQGDTEVILKAYHAWGIEALQKLEGMFAFALWERDSGRTILARDRLGIKPLYYSVNRDFLTFASNTQALLNRKDLSTELDPTALNYYLNFHAIVPAPHTIFKSIQKLKPGHFAIIESGSVNSLGVNHQGEQDIVQQPYWRLDFETAPGDEKLTEQDWQERLLEELRLAVRKRLVAAVDVGVLLSGGVDSSLLVGLMAEQGKAQVKTYSVGFESIGSEVGDEFIYSDLIAERFATDHHKIVVSSDELLSELPNAIQAMSEPMVSHDCIGFYLLSREVSKTCKAVQSGQGADEVFGGYHWYPPLIDTQDPFASYRQAFFDRSYQEYLETVNPPYQTSDAASEWVKAHFEGVKSRDAVEKALHIDTTVMLVDDPVKRVDNMTMAWGLEARVPFLDHRLVEFAARIPSCYKVSGEGKTILKEAARRVVPAAVIDRPKGYFPVPALKYLRGSVLEYVKEALCNQSAQQRGLFNKQYVNQLLDNPEAHITPLRGSKLWQLGLLELWLQGIQS